MCNSFPTADTRDVNETGKEFLRTSENPVTLPQYPPPGRFGHATAGYVDSPKAAMGSRHQPGTAPRPAGDRPSPFSPPPAIQLRSCT